MILIYSGGMDSTVLLNLYKKEISACISFKYGAKHNEMESRFAEENCADLGIKRFVVDLEFIRSFFKSSLLDPSTPVPHGHYTHESMKSTVVHFRNGIMISIAAGMAESFGEDRVAIANHAGDHAIYPDCRTDFVEKMRASVKAGTEKGIDVFAPFSDITKRDIALIGEKEKVNFNKTWSCYEGEDLHCGKCGTCFERKEALLGFDKTEYKS